MSDFCFDSMNAAAFPVICLSDDGRVAAKNRAAYTYLPKIRIKSSLLPKASFSGCGNAVLDDAKAPFRYAVCVPVSVGEKTVRIFMFLPSIQSGDHFENGKTVDAERIFDIINCEKQEAEPRRIYSEMAEAFSAFDRESAVLNSVTDVCKTSALLDKLLSSRFRALGYRATVHCTDSVNFERNFALNFYAFVYSVLTAAYVAMRLSSSGAAEIVIDYDDDMGYLKVTSSSRTSAKMPRGARCAEDAIAALVPEYAVEMMADKELSSCRAEKKCSVKNGIFTFSIPIKADTRGAELRSRTSLYSLEDIVGGLFDTFARSAKNHLPRIGKSAK